MTNPPAITRESLIEAHEFWSLQFHILIDDPQTRGTIAREHIANHTHCDLGRLLASGRVTFANPLIADILRDVHASFHGVAALILDLHDHGGSRAEIAEYLNFLDQLSAQLKDILQNARIGAA